MEVIIVGVMINEDLQFMINPDTDKIFRFDTLENAILYISLTSGATIDQVKEDFLFYGVDPKIIDEQEEKNM